MNETQTRTSERRGLSLCAASVGRRLRRAASAAGAACLGAALALALAGCAGGAGGGRAATLDESQRALAVQSFDEVWTTIRDRHFDPSLNGVDWEAVRAEYRPKVEAATTDEQARDATNGAIARLGQSHFGLIPASAYGSLEAPGQGGAASDAPEEEGFTGLHLRAVDGAAVVFAVDEGSPAHAAGVRAGMIVEEVDGQRPGGVIKDVGESFEGKPQRLAMMSRATQGLVEGPLGEKVVLKVKGAGGAQRLSITRGAPLGTPAKFGFLPTIFVTNTARRLDGNIGYIAFNIFLDPGRILPWFGERVGEFADARGIIVDLRGNPGGIGIMAMAMGNWFVDRPDLKLGTMKTRETSLNFVLNPRPDGYRGPVAILVDELSMSTSEIMAGGLQAIGRARVFGTPTPGMALPSTIVKLPSGDGFQYATANYVSADGNVLEGRGVTPDEIVMPDPASLRAGRDPALEAAVKWIGAQSGS